MKPYYQDDAVTIYHGDCREILPNFQQGAFGSVVTDPPYGVGKSGWDEEFPTWWFNDAQRLAGNLALMPGVWNLGRIPHEIGRLRYRWTLCAHLTNGMTRGAIGFGNWIPCVLYAEEGVSIYREESDVRTFAVGTEVKPDHPSPKPLRVMTWFLSRLRGSPHLDPFCGSGTTLVAAKLLNHKAVGIEIEERYCEIAARRCAQEVLDLGDTSARAVAAALGETA